MNAVLSGKRVFSPHSRWAGTGLLVLCLALASAAGIAQTVAPTITPSSPAPRGVRVIAIGGTIAPSLVPKIRSVLEALEPDRFPAGALLLLDSRGGDGLAAMEIGRLARAAKAHVFVRGRCASACVYILAGGVVRGVARDRAVGIHAPRLTTFVKGLGVVDINSASNPNAAAALQAGNRQTQEYFKEMGMTDELFSAMMAAPSDQTRYLDLGELREFGLVGIDPEYRAARAARAAAQYGIAEDEFARRTLVTAERCLGEAAMPQEIARCYARVLRTGQ